MQLWASVTTFGSELYQDLGMCHEHDPEKRLILALRMEGYRFLSCQRKNVEVSFQHVF